MIKVVAPMAGITNSDFLNKVIPYGFDVATLGGYSLDEPTIDASKKIIGRGRKEFDFLRCPSDSGVLFRKYEPGDCRPLPSGKAGRGLLPGGGY